MTSQSQSHDDDDDVYPSWMQKLSGNSQ
jgi:hypothetical protein